MNSIVGVPEKDWYMYDAANTVCKGKREEFKDDITNEQINEIINLTVSMFENSVSDKEMLANYLKEQISIERQMPDARIMKSNEVKDLHWWSDYAKDNQLKYWSRYRRYLKDDNGWDGASIEKSIDLPTDEIMNSIIAPTKGVVDERRGMVVGYVQSGKTANYIGLINKAIDAGYKIIIVLAGMHNNLRSQTQSRIDEEVLGYETSIAALEKQKEMAEKNVIGVGKYNCGGFIQTLTSRDEQGDYKKTRSGIQISPELPIVIVTKKVKSILENVYDNYYHNHAIAVLEDGTRKMPAKYPLLIIDDEADQASINNNIPKSSKEAEETEPTSINRLIREILNLFDSKSYVGYTATPYANIFINNEEINPAYGYDLFPKDFIVSLPKPRDYVGANEFFGSENVKAMPLFREVKDSNFIDVKEGYVGDVPEDLKEAIISFIISVSVRNCRGYLKKPNSMLIHGARINDLQTQIRYKVEDYYSNLRSEIINNDREIWNIIDSIYDDYIKTTEEMLEEKSYSNYMQGIEVIDKNLVFEEIKRLCNEDKIEIKTINGKSKEGLEYKEMAKAGKEYNVIAIGGDKLSRGLTLEGLLISYFIRESKTYDTLMQMGRWFGFRKGYIDLCRVYSTEFLKKAFHKIAFATDDLRNQIEYMCDIEEQPETFGLKVASDPLLKISNKIHKPVELYLDFSNTLIQSRSFDKSVDVYNENSNAVDKLLRAAGKYKSISDYNNGESKGNSLVWENVPGRLVQEFFAEYKTSKKAQKIRGGNIAKYIKEQLKVGGLTEWTVCLRNVKSKKDYTIDDLAGLPPIGGGIVRDDKENCDEVEKNVISLKSVKSKDHEFLDCSKQTRENVEAEAKKLKDEGKKLYPSFAGYVRSECRKKIGGRKKGLLVLYPIDYRNEDYETKIFNIKGQNHKTPIGFMAVFPDRENKGKAISYQLNPVAATEEKLNELFE